MFAINFARGVDADNITMPRIITRLQQTQPLEFYVLLWRNIMSGELGDTHEEMSKLEVQLPRPNISTKVQKRTVG